MTHIESELLETVKAKNEVLKWKLVVVGALGAIGLGADKGVYSPWAIGLIPVLCLYVDLVYRNLCLRVKTIESFISCSEITVPDIELTRGFLKFHQQHQENVKGISLEAGAILLSSLLFSILVAASPCLINRPDFLEQPPIEGLNATLRALGAVGFFGALALEGWYTYRVRHLFPGPL